MGTNYARFPPDNPSIVINDAPQVAHLKKLFPQIYKEPWSGRPPAGYRDPGCSRTNTPHRHSTTPADRESQRVRGASFSRAT